LKVKAVICTESLATVGWSWLAAEFPAGGSKHTNANDKIATAE
jgi:hypothetical protein